MVGACRFKDNDDQFLRTNEFFTRVLDLVIASVPVDNTELLETLNRIFDDNRAFYYHTFEKEVLTTVPFLDNPRKCCAPSHFIVIK